MKSFLTKIKTQIIQLIESKKDMATKMIESRMIEPKKNLGRWNLDYCDKKIEYKVNWTNEDHCGPCGDYILQKQAPEPILLPPFEKRLIK